MESVNGSFRDPCGRVYLENGKILRTVTALYQPDWEHAVHSGLFEELTSNGRLVKFTEIPPCAGAWKCLDVERIPWISYPYEWSFHQLRDAARLTLDIHKAALKAGMSLKDASAYNVQFVGSRPVFIDILSFERRESTAPWQAYRQFCMHFLAPLALYSADHRLSRLSAGWIDGIPLDLAWSLLPARMAFSFGLQMHLNLHGKAEKKHNDGRKAAQKVKNVSISTQGLLDLADSLLRTIDSLPEPATPGDWSDYYTDTNYTSTAAQAKEKLVDTLAGQCAGELAIDLGANTGCYSAIISRHFTSVIAADIDAPAVGSHYARLRKEGNAHILPLVQDLANPSPAIGWACSERQSWMQRPKADFVSALALIHHIYFTCGIPWKEQAAFFAGLLRPGGQLMMEFVPREDSQVKRMLAARDDIFADYNLDDCCSAFSEHFVVSAVHPLSETERQIILLTKRNTEQ